MNKFQEEHTVHTTPVFFKAPISMRASKHNKQWHSLVVYFFAHIKPVQMSVTWILPQINSKIFIVAIFDIFKMWTTHGTMFYHVFHA